MLSKEYMNPIGSPERVLFINRKILYIYKGKYLAFTAKQIDILHLVSLGYSNMKIARKLSMKEPTVKLITYRIMRYVERTFKEKVDRFSLIVIAQRLGVSNKNNYLSCIMQ